jgi:hypothetical protein
MGPSQLLIKQIPGDTRGKSGRDVALNTHHHPALRLKKE